MISTFTISFPLSTQRKIDAGTLFKHKSDADFIHILVGMLVSVLHERPHQDHFRFIKYGIKTITIDETKLQSAAKIIFLPSKCEIIIIIL